MKELDFGIYAKSSVFICHTANLPAEVRHDQWTPPADVEAEPVPELEFNQTFGWQSCAEGMADAAERGNMLFRCWPGAVSVAD